MKAKPIAMPLLISSYIFVLSSFCFSGDWAKGTLGHVASDGVIDEHDETTPFPPPSGLAQRLFQEPTAKSKFLESVAVNLDHHPSNPAEERHDRARVRGVKKGIPQQ